MSNTKKPIPKGWNALVDRVKGIARPLGEVKHSRNYAVTSLEVVTAPTEPALMELLAGLKIEKPKV